MMTRTTLPTSTSKMLVISSDRQALAPGFYPVVIPVPTYEVVIKKRTDSGKKGSLKGSGKRGFGSRGKCKEGTPRGRSNVRPRVAVERIDRQGPRHRAKAVKGYSKRASVFTVVVITGRECVRKVHNEWMHLICLSPAISGSCLHRSEVSRLS